jgi:hypothetical protein
MKPPPALQIRKIVKTLEMHNPKKVQYDQYDGNYDQSMDPTASTRDARTDVPAEKAEQP